MSQCTGCTSRLFYIPCIHNIAFVFQKEWAAVKLMVVALIAGAVLVVEMGFWKMVSPITDGHDQDWTLL